MSVEVYDLAKNRQHSFPIEDHHVFYVVWGAHTKIVRKRHPSRKQAMGEAKRLAALTGRRYYILKADTRIDGDATLAARVQS